MKVLKDHRGFQYLEAPKNGYGELQVQQSSAIGDYWDSMEKPGSSFLWIGEAHLNRKEVEELVGHLNQWLTTASLTSHNPITP